MTLTNVTCVGQTPTLKGIFFSIFTLLTIFIFSSCKDDDGPTFILPSPPIEVFETSNYSLLNSGNYWIYQQYHITPDGAINPGNIDSTYVDGDTLINGEIFTKLHVNAFGSSSIALLRDSADYIIDEQGRKRLGLNDFGEFLFSVDHYILKTDYYMVGHRPLLTELDDFETALKKEGKNIFYDPQDDPNCGPSSNEYWVKDLGMVREEAYFASSCSRLRRDLVRYRVE